MDRRTIYRSWRPGISALLLCATWSLASAADWPQWRGPTRDGVTTGVELPDPWPKRLRQLWQMEVGLGHSSPVVAGGKLVQLARVGSDEMVRCLNAADGKLLWRDTYPAGPFAPRPPARPHAKGPFATPTIANGKVYTLGVSGVLTCYDLASGKPLWRKTFAGQFRNTHPIWGAANSPLVDGKLCILGVGTDSDGALAAFDANAGKIIWTLNDGPAYTSPQVATLAGRRQIVTLTHSRVVGVSPESGKVLWMVPYKVKYDMNIISPVVHDDVVVYSGYYAGTTALRIASQAGTLATTRLWHNERESMFMGSPVRHGGHIYGLAMRGKGTLVCLRLSDGQTVWSSPGHLGQCVSLVRVGNRLLVLTTKGDLLAVLAEPSDYTVIGRSRLTDRPVWAHLAVTGDRLYVKDKTHLTCFQLAGE